MFSAREEQQRITMTFEDLTFNCKNDLQVARNKRDEASIQMRIQNEVIESLITQLGRLEKALTKSKEPLLR